MVFESRLPIYRVDEITLYSDLLCCARTTKPLPPTIRAEVVRLIQAGAGDTAIGKAVGIYPPICAPQGHLRRGLKSKYIRMCVLWHTRRCAGAHSPHRTSTVSREIP